VFTCDEDRNAAFYESENQGMSVLRYLSPRDRDRDRRTSSSDTRVESSLVDVGEV
jgi:hypothetical protein